MGLLEAYRAEPNPLVQALDDARTLVALLGEIGFTGVKVIEQQNEIVYASPEEWWASRQGEFAARLAPHVLPRFKVEALAQLAVLTQADGLHRLSVVRFNLATKPSQPD